MPTGLSLTGAGGGFALPFPTITLTGGTLTSDATYYYYSWIGVTSAIRMTISGGPLSISYLCVGRGGSGGRANGGGGGAGGMLEGSYSFPTGGYRVQSGWSAGVDTNARSFIQDDASLAFIVLTRGGGNGGFINAVSPFNTVAPQSGGSGGGTRNNTNTTPGAGTAGQGNSGGQGDTTPGGGGGGGANGAGDSGAAGRWGGVGRVSNLRGTGNVTYAVGGRGGTSAVANGSNQLAGSGNGGNSRITSSGDGESGSDGIVVIRYLRSAVGG
jgi:hypothetical protein